MEIFGGFMVMMSIVTLFLAVVWLIMPFVVFAIKGRQDRMLEVLETIDKRLTVIEERLRHIGPDHLEPCAMRADAGPTDCAAVSNSPAE